MVMRWTADCPTNATAPSSCCCCRRSIDSAPSAHLYVRWQLFAHHDRDRSPVRLVKRQSAVVASRRGHRARRHRLRSHARTDCIRNDLVGESACLSVTPEGSSMVANIVGSVGAGIFEELVFRLGLMSHARVDRHAALCAVGPYRRWLAGALFAVVGSALVFSWFHHLCGEPFDRGIGSCFARWLECCSACLMWARGYGVCVYTHTVYNIYYYVSVSLMALVMSQPLRPGDRSPNLRRLLFRRQRQSATASGSSRSCCSHGHDGAPQCATGAALRVLRARRRPAERRSSRRRIWLAAVRSRRSCTASLRTYTRSRRWRRRPHPAVPASRRRSSCRAAWAHLRASRTASRATSSNGRRTSPSRKDDRWCSCRVRRRCRRCTSRTCSSSRVMGVDRAAGDAGLLSPSRVDRRSGRLRRRQDPRSHRCLARTSSRVGRLPRPTRRSRRSQRGTKGLSSHVSERSGPLGRAGRPSAGLVKLSHSVFALPFACCRCLDGYRRASAALRLLVLVVARGRRRRARRRWPSTATPIATLDAREPAHAANREIPSKVLVTRPAQCC